MKKIVVVIVCFFFSIMLVDAKVCEVKSGDGISIGSEISCGSENFYVVSNDGENIKMLAKYNLLVGRNYYKVDFDSVITNYTDAKNYWNENYANDYFGRYSWIQDDDSNYIGAYAYNIIESDEILQDSSAIGAHGGITGAPEFPEVGIVSSDWVQSDYINNYSGDKRFLDFDYDVTDTEEESVYYYLTQYMNTLNNMGVDIDDVSTLSLSEINNLIYELTGEYLPLEEWYEDAELHYDEVFDTRVYVLGSIKEKLGENYEWLWGTTYWLRTLSVSEDGDISQYFIDTLGDLCTGDYCFYSMGAGVRPVVTISTEDVTYNIETKTDGNGNINISKNKAESGVKIEFIVIPNDGYELNEIKITDSYGNTILFDDNAFIMPDSNVLIEASFILSHNPNTNTFVSGVFIMLCIVCLFILFINRKRLLKFRIKV